ncbi:MAG: efflux RND transporter periplasmic adaptor subunit [Planctomycetes bacterium]|nr:efflux RND transporter periplasmic adaptor subunit [Planctomycetota bacterium]
MSAKKTILSIVGATLLLSSVAGAAYGIWLYKQGTREAAAAAAGSQPEPAEVVEALAADTTTWTPTSTAIGTVRALRSITLRNELAGTVTAVALTTGKRVAAGDLLVEIDVAVEQAQLAALQAEARLAETMLGRMERALEQQGASAADVDRARAERDMAVANVRRVEALIEQKRLRAPFDAIVGLVDLHVGQYLQPGSEITTLQGVADAVHVDFPVTQEVARSLEVGAEIEVVLGKGTESVPGRIAALDARVDVMTRNRQVRAVLKGVTPLPQPGASVRVSVPVGAPREVVVVPVSALRRSPAGNSVFVLHRDDSGATRASFRPVDSGTVLGDLVVIEQGVQAGELVATTGSFKLREGALVVRAGAHPKAGGDQPARSN